eukprot:CFRG7517T1
MSASSPELISTHSSSPGSERPAQSALSEVKKEELALTGKSPKEIARTINFLRTRVANLEVEASRREKELSEAKAYIEQKDKMHLDIKSELSYQKSKIAETTKHVHRLRAESVNLEKTTKSRDQCIADQYKHISALEKQLQLLKDTEVTDAETEAEKLELMTLRQEVKELETSLEQMISIVDPKRNGANSNLKTIMTRLSKMQTVIDEERKIQERQNRMAMIAGASIFACIAVISQWFLA